MPELGNTSPCLITRRDERCLFLIFSRSRSILMGMAEQGKDEPRPAHWLDRMLEAGLQIPRDLPTAERARRLKEARMAVAELAPEDAGLAERVLAVQAVIAHKVAMDCMDRCDVPDLPDKARFAALDNAIRYMNLFNRQVASLAASAKRRRAQRPANTPDLLPRGTAGGTAPDSDGKPQAAAQAKPRRRKDGSWLH